MNHQIFPVLPNLPEIGPLKMNRDLSAAIEPIVE